MVAAALAAPFFLAAGVEASPLLLRVIGSEAQLLWEAALPLRTWAIANPVVATELTQFGAGIGFQILDEGTEGFIEQLKTPEGIAMLLFDVVLTYAGVRGARGASGGQRRTPGQLEPMAEQEEIIARIRARGGEIHDEIEVAKLRRSRAMSGEDIEQPNVPRRPVAQPESVNDAVTPDGKPVPKLGERIPELRTSRDGGGYTGHPRAKQRLRALRRRAEEIYGKAQAASFKDSEIHADRLYRDDNRTSKVTMGEGKVAEGLEMPHRIDGDELPMADLLVEDKHGRLVPTEVKAQGEPHLVGKGNSAERKFESIVSNAPKKVLDRIDRFEVLVSKDARLPRNLRVTAGGELWELVDGTSRPQVWRRVEYAGKPVIVRKADLGPEFDEPARKKEGER